jgi:hypothetical protein
MIAEDRSSKRTKQMNIANNAGEFALKSRTQFSRIALP